MLGEVFAELLAGLFEFACEFLLEVASECVFDPLSEAWERWRRRGGE